MMRLPSLLLLLALLVGVNTAQAAGLADAKHAPTELPRFVFVDKDGTQHSFSEYRGRYLLINFWGSWCPPCLKELPSLDRLQALFPLEKLTVLPVSMDHSESTVSYVYRRAGITHLPVFMDPTIRAPLFFQFDGFPVTLLVNPEGKEIARFEGDHEWDGAEMRAALQNVMMP